jgi:hypothetical protein
LKQHPKFFSSTVNQVGNTMKAKSMTDFDSHVLYAFALDDRKENAGNAVLIWANKGRVHEDVIEITNRGYKFWASPPHSSINGLINWWKRDGHKERQHWIEEWRRVHQGVAGN